MASFVHIFCLFVPIFESLSVLIFLFVYPTIAVTLCKMQPTIVDLSVNISLAPDYKLPAAAFTVLPAPATAFAPPPPTQNKNPVGADSTIRKAEDVVTGMLAKGFILGKDAVNKAKSFDEKHRLTSTASAKVASFDKKISFTEKVSAGTTVVAKAAGDVGQKTKEKVGAAEEERKRKVVDDFARIHLSDESPIASEPNEQKKNPSKPAPAQGLIL
ncbi:Binding partner of ACD11 1 [Hibiscus syriacus]|uniref:Binding partner of ACD11 1 n=1 Tax=Hibiscus syriacus TaxID=106335 RepID=A0A6A2WNU4_HIBSY|nr:Binding partner of ACD11 1 [Hibiscus syriacus]